MIFGEYTFEYPGIEGGLVLGKTMILWSGVNLLTFSSGFTLDFFSSSACGSY